ncbi:hypothetical protein BDR22DRAFT_893203 [Usnea florida]
MRPQPFLAAALSLFTALSSASINGIAVPSSIAPGSTFRVTITTVDFIQTVQDVAIAFGLAPNADIANTSLGTLLNSKYLGPDDSNIESNITHFVEIPNDVAQGPIVFTAALFSLLGAEYEPSLQTFSVNVTVGAFTSSDLVGSLPGTSVVA